MNRVSLVYVFIIIGLIASCSPQKRLHRLISKHPELVKIDSVRIIDTIVIPAITTYDTIEIATMPDTVVIEREKVRIEIQKIKVEGKPKLVFKTEYKQDTVIITKVVPKYALSVYEKDEKNYWYIWVLVGILFTMAIMVGISKIPKL